MTLPPPLVKAESSYDFASQQRTIESPSSGAIRVGDTVKNVQSGDLLTHAEFAALTQVLSGGRQSIEVGALGNAVGGRVNLVEHIPQSVGNLVIPDGLTAIVDFSAMNALNLRGTLVNSGKLYAYTSSDAVTTAVISADSIFNQGLITSLITPSSFLPGNAVSSLNLSLLAVNDIVNAGIISSSGSLALTAGGRIVNGATTAGATNALLQAANHLNLSASQITNSTLAASLNGHINLAARLNEELTVNASAGQFRAFKGAINVRDVLFSGNSATNLSGGDYLAEQLNIFGGGGVIRVDIGESSGTLNSQGLVAHVSTNSDLLTLGNICMLGDPTFYNAGGSIVLTGDISVGEALAIIASDDITNTAAAAPISLTARDGGGQGYDILLIAGATFTGSGGPTFPSPTDQSLTISDLPGSGSVDFSTQPVTINSSSIAGNLSGGNVTIASFDGAINLAGSTINSSGIGNGADGNVTIIGGQSGVVPLVVNNINTTGGAGGGGNVIIQTFTPTFAAGNAMTIDVAGNADTDVIANSVAPHNQSIVINGIINSGSISIASEGVTVNGALAASGSVNIDGGLQAITGAGALSGFALALTADDITVSGKVTGLTLSLAYDPGNSVVLNTDVANLITLSGGSLTVNEDNGINLMSQSLSNLTINSGLLAANDVFIIVPITIGNLTINAAQGNIAVNANVTGNVNFTATGSISGAGTLNGTNVTLIGNSISMFSKISATNLTVGFNNAASVNLSTNVVNLTSLSGGTLNVFENDGINLLNQAVTNLRVSNGFVGSGDVVIASDLNVADLKIDAIVGGISLANDISGITGTAELIAETTISGSGSISGNNISLDANAITATGKLSGNNLTIALNAGNSSTLLTDVANLTTTSGASLTINEDSGLTLLSQNVSNLSVNAGLAAAGDLTVGADLTVGSMTFNSNQGGISVDNNLTGSLNLTASGSISGSGAISGPTVSLDADSINSTGKITASNLTVAFNNGQTASLVTDVDTLTSNAGGTLIVNEDDGVNLQIQNVSNLEVNAGLASTGDVIISNVLNMSSIKIDSRDGDIAVNNDITAPSIDLKASGTIYGPGLINGNSIKVSADSVNLSGKVTGGSLDVSFDSAGTVNLNTDIDTLTANGGNLTVNEDNGITLLQQDVANLTVNAGLTGPGDVTVAADIDSGNVSLDSNQGSVALSNTVTATSLDIDASGTISGAGAITAGSVSLTGSQLNNSGRITATDLTVGFDNGNSASLSTDVTTLTSLSGGTLTVNEDNGIKLLLQNVSDLNVNAGISAAGDVEVGADLTVVNFDVNSARGGIILSNSVNSTNTELTAASDISGSGKLTSTTLTVGFDNGQASAINTDVVDLISLSGGTLTVNEDDGINLMSQSLSNLNVSAGLLAAGDVIIGADLDLNGLDIDSAQGDIAINNDIDAMDIELTASGSIYGPGKINGDNLTVGFGNLQSASLNTNVATLEALSGGTLTVNEENGIRLLGQNVSSLNLSAGLFGAGDIVIDTALNLSDLQLSSAQGGISFGINAITASGDAALQSFAGISGTGKISAVNLSVDFDAAASVVLNTNVASMTSVAGLELTINEDDGIILLSQSAGSLEVIAGLAGAGDVVIGADLILTDLTVDARQGNIAVDNDITANTVDLRASGLITGSGQINASDLTVGFSTTGSITLSTNVQTLTSTAGGTMTVNERDGIVLQGQSVDSLAINAGLVAAGNVNVAGSMDITDIAINAAQGDIQLNGAIIASGDVDLIASGAITGSGKITGDTLTVDFNDSASVTLTTNVTSLALTGGGTLVVTEDDGINLLGQAVDNLSVTAGNGGAGDVTISQDLLLITSLFIDSRQGNIAVDNDVSAQTVELKASGEISGNGKITAANLTVDFASGSSASLTTNVDNLISNSGGTLTVNEDNAINLFVQLVENLTVNADAVTVETGLDLGDLTINADNGDIIINQAIQSNNLVLNNIDPTGGDIVLNASIQGDTSVALSATGMIIQVGPAVISGGLLTINNFSGPLTLTTDVDSLSSMAPGQQLTINEANGISLGDQSLAQLTVNASQISTGDIEVDGAVNVTNAVTLVNSGAGNIAGTGLITADTLNLTAGTGSVDLVTDVNTLSAISSGNISIGEVNDLNIGPISANDLTITAGPGSTIETIADVIAQGVVSLETNKLINNYVISGDIVSVFNDEITGVDGMTISGQGTISSAIVTNLVATAGNLTFEPNTDQSFFGMTNLIANQGGQAVVLNSGVVLTGADALNVTTANFQINGATVSASPFKLVSATGQGIISNNTGDVILPASLTFVGTDLTIIASGNVIGSTKATSIKLSGKTGDSGSLAIIAGFDFDVLSGTTNASSPVSGVYQITGQSASGGSVFLAKTTINTSNSTLNRNGGNVTVIAKGGAENAGSISLGAINASANLKGGIGGAVNLIGQGGVQTKAITTKGATGGSVTIFGASPKMVAGPIFISNGVLNGPGVFIPEAASISNAAGVLVTGSIITSSSLQRGGNVTLSADSQIEVTGGISATGLIGPNVLVPEGGGDVSLTSTTSKVSVGSLGINTSANPFKSALNAGDGGSISIQAASLISVGKLIAKGGNNTLTGDAGSGGNVSLTTDTATIGASQYAIGNIKVAGFIDTRGGNAAAKSSGDAGSGGNVVLAGATVAITRSTSGASVITSAGLKGLTGAAGSSGSVTINTFALQPLPVNLDLISTSKNVPVLPGALFTIGSGNPINGVASNIVAGTTKITKKSNAFVVEGGPINGGGINVEVLGSTVDADLDGVPTTFVSHIAGKRQTVTPSVALALFQASRNQAQSIFVNNRGQALPGGSASFDQLELNGYNFTAFKIPTGIALSFTGSRPMVTLPASILLQGTLNFPTASSIAYVNTGSASLTVAPTAAITAETSSQLILSGTGANLKNLGLIDVGELVFARPSATGLTFTTGAQATTRASAIVLGPSHDVGMTFTFKASGASQFTAPVQFDNVSMPTAYKANAIGIANNINLLRTANVTFSLADNAGAAITPVIGGTLNAGSINIRSAMIAVGSNKAFTPITIDDGTSLTARRVLKIASVAKLSIGDNVALTAGVLKPTALPWSSPSLLGSKDTLTAGSFVLTSSGIDGIEFGAGGTFNESGRKLSVTASAGGIDLGSNNTFTAMGGDVVILAKQAVTGDSGNQFRAKGIEKQSNGGIEIASGQTSSTLASAFSKRAGTQPGSLAVLGSNTVNVTNNGGVVIVNNSGGTLDLSPNAANPLSLTLNKGAVVFGAKGATASVIIDGGSFETRSAKPIAFRSTLTSLSTVYTFAEDGQVDVALKSNRYRTKITGTAGSQMSSGDHQVLLIRGEALIDTDDDIEVVAADALVSLKKGALVHVDTRGGNVQVKACSNPGDVTVYAFNYKFPLPPGQEVILVGGHAPTAKDRQPADGIGRRNQETRIAEGGHVVMSDFSMMTVMANLKVLRASAKPSNKKVVERMLKTAAAIDVITRNRGAYSAQPREVQKHRNFEMPSYAAQGKDGHLKPVSFNGQ